MEPGEGHHVDGQLAQIGVELSGEPEAGRDPGHGRGHEVVEVPVGGGGQLEGAEADVVESLVVDAVRLVRVLNQLVDGEGRVVWLHDCVRHLWRGEEDYCIIYLLNLICFCVFLRKKYT